VTKPDMMLRQNEKNDALSSPSARLGEVTLMTFQSVGGGRFEAGEDRAMGKLS
jgi:hypothetical protein